MSIRVEVVAVAVGGITVAVIVVECIGPAIFEAQRAVHGRCGGGSDRDEEQAGEQAVAHRSPLDPEFCRCYT